MSDLYLFQNALKDLLRPRRLLLALFLIATPTLLVILWRMTLKHADAIPPDSIYNEVSGRIIFGFILVLLSVVFSTSVISQEIENKTVSYLLTRPLPRWRFLLLKFIAVFLVTTAIAEIAVIVIAQIIYGSSGLGQAGPRQDMALLPLGVLTFGSLFLMIASLLNRPLILGLMYGFGWESVMSIFAASAPGSFNHLFLISYFRALAPHLMPSDEGGSLQLFNSNLPPTPIPIWLAWTVLSSVCVLCLGGALYFFSTREYVPRDDAE
ncbi:MAG TPA: ABC transporter permease [Chthonomonadaceae bacterium]|nr:ABC transporter permease [Chthonomonadaceae bacterium]